MNDTDLLPNVLEPGNLRSRCSMVSITARVLFRVADWGLLTLASHGGEQRGEASSLVALTGALIPFMALTGALIPFI